jgi:dephospho-CoA kinase
MRVWGLTGNIACGKSAVEDFLRSASVPVIDADRVARDIVRPGEPALDEIVAAFGAAILDDGGLLNRVALGQIIFADSSAKKRLEDITHPRIHARIAEELSQLAQEETPLALVSAALMVETGSYTLYEGMIVVTCPEEIQLQRLVARDGLSEADARARIDSQMPQSAKASLAELVIDNGGPLETTLGQVQDWLEELGTKP